jgi:hypothetical protein
MGGTKTAPDERRSAGLDRSTNRLLATAPQFSAFRTISRGQGRVLLVLGAGLLAGLWLSPLRTLIVVNTLLTALYLLVLAYNIRILRATLSAPALEHVTDAEARAVPDHALPTFTVMVAAYHESGVIAGTIRALGDQ